MKRPDIRDLWAAVQCEIASVFEDDDRYQYPRTAALARRWMDAKRELVAAELAIEKAARRTEQRSKK